MKEQVQEQERLAYPLADIENVLLSEGTRQRIIKVVTTSTEIEDKFKELCEREVEYQTLKATVKNWRYWIPIIATAILAFIGIVI